MLPAKYVLHWWRSRTAPSCASCRIADPLGAIQDAEVESAVSVAIFYRWLRAGRSSKGTPLPDTGAERLEQRTFVDRKQLAEALTTAAE